MVRRPLDRSHLPPAMPPGLLAVATAALIVVRVGASLQGLYQLDAVGQLARVEPASGRRTAIGRSLASVGWALPPDGCSPTAIDTTGKWIYTFARNASAPPGARWQVLGIELANASVRKWYALPAEFPPSLRACDHTLTEDGAWHVYVTAVTRHAATPRLVGVRMTYTWPASDECVPVVDVPVLPLGAGGGAFTPTSAVTNTTLWVSLARGLVGIDVRLLPPAGNLPYKAGDSVRWPLLSPGPPRVWLFPPGGSVVGGLQYDIVGVQRQTYFMLAANGSTSSSAKAMVGTGTSGRDLDDGSGTDGDGDGAVRLAQFADDGTGPIRVQLAPGRMPRMPHAPNLVALLSDHAEYTFVDASGNLITVDLAKAAIVDRVAAWCSQASGHVAAHARLNSQARPAQQPSNRCPLLIAYQPFVFSGH